MMSTGGVAKPKTLYKRTLQPPCIAFSSVDGRKLFREALLEGNMETYFRLAEQFRTQDDPAFCGLSTLTMVLNALAVDPGRTWKGPWRWYHESMLDCCAPLDTVREVGITLGTMACLARCNGLEVEMGGPNTHSLEDLRAFIVECSSEDRGKVVVVSYDRKGLKQTGSGHFSPIGGYHQALDLVLILDTARFKLPPHWVPLSVLWKAMETIDTETGRPRGFMVLQKVHSLSHRLFTSNQGNYEDWPQVASWVEETIELACVRQDGRSRVDPDAGKEFRAAVSMSDFVGPLLERVSPEVKELLTTFKSASRCKLGKEQDGIVLQAIQGTEAYRAIQRLDRSSGRPSRSVSCNSNFSDDKVRVSPPISSTARPAAVGCYCSSRHVISMLTYALLSILHKRDFSAACEKGDRSVLPGGHLWREDPLEMLPKAVEEEAMHVAGMLTGLIEMESV